MMNSVTRFSNRVDDYARYRPSYPAGVTDILNVHCGLKKMALIADIGSGTGFLSEVFLKNGNRVLGVEPNAEMRLTAERLLAGYGNFASVEATAEATTLETASIDFITAGQAFHWFDREQAKREFARILKPGGWVVLIWNERVLDSTPFLQEYERLLLRYGTDYENVRHERVTEEIAQFFAPESFQLKSLENAQRFNLEGLNGRVRSSSYTPEPGHQDFEPMLDELEQLFNAHQRDGIVTFEYQTRVYFGRLTGL
jgi:SAM-dependent methyltransferase